MQIIKKPEEAGSLIFSGDVSQKVGLVPTMGYLHEGHLSLVRRCRKENERCVVSIFVNPIQFGPDEDLESYPRNMQKDLSLLEREGVDLVFAPDASDMFSDDFSTFVDEKFLSSGLCGASRPGHFKGVCTIVLKLFNILRPDRAYFGEKDYQQLQVIKRMVRDLNVNVDVIGCPIIREKDGLAMSSRNMYLSEKERNSALLLHRSMLKALELVEEGERSCNMIKDSVMEIFDNDPQISVEYVCIKNSITLEDMDYLYAEAVLAVAARVGRARLIDNTRLKPLSK